MTAARGCYVFAAPVGNAIQHDVTADIDMWSFVGFLWHVERDLKVYSKSGSNGV